MASSGPVGGSRFDEKRLTRARGLLWAAIFCGFIYSTARTDTEVQSVTIGIWDIVRGGGPLVLLSLGVLTHPPVRRHVGLVEVGVLAFLAVAVASTAWSVSPEVTLLKAIPLVACYLAMMRLVRLYRDALAAIRALVSVVHGLLVLAACQFVLVPGLSYTPVGIYSDQPRLSMVAPQISPNPLALLAVLGILSIVLKVGPRWMMSRPLLTAALTLVYLGELLATRTRTGLAIGLVLVAVAVLSQINRRPALVVNLGLAATAAALWMWTPERIASIEGFLTRGQSASGLQSLTGRTVLWDIALEKWSEDRLLGFGYFAGQRLGLTGVADSQSNIDSTWIELLVGVGLLGTVPLALAAVVGLRRVWAVTAPRSEWLWLAGVAVAAAATSLVNPTLQGPGLGFLLFSYPVLLASVFGARNGDLAERGDTDQRRDVIDPAPDPGGTLEGVEPQPGSVCR